LPANALGHSSLGVSAGTARDIDIVQCPTWFVSQADAVACLTAPLGTDSRALASWRPRPQRSRLVQLFHLKLRPESAGHRQRGPSGRVASTASQSHARIPPLPQRSQFLRRRQHGRSSARVPAGQDEVRRTKGHKPSAISRWPTSPARCRQARFRAYNDRDAIRRPNDIDGSRDLVTCPPELPRQTSDCGL